MPWTSQHIEWLDATGDEITLSCGAKAPVFQFNHDALNATVMSAWARHFRNHYCNDSEIDILKPMGMSKEDYLLELKFPSRNTKAGPATRSGDFAEILVADYLTFLNGYIVPRTRYDRKTITDESTKGSDVLAFKEVGGAPNAMDELLVFEVKAKLVKGSVSDNRLQDAINDSKKDDVRIGESLNAIKQRLHDRSDTDGVRRTGRFQLYVDKPYIRRFGAAAVLTQKSFSAEKLSEASTESHPEGVKLELLVIVGSVVMDLVHALYERSANEA